MARDLNEIEGIARRFELSSNNFCCMVGVCNRSEAEIKENIEAELKHHLEKLGFIILADTAFDLGSQEGIFSSNPDPKIIYWIDLMAIDYNKVLTQFEQNREILLKNAASIFILTDFNGIELLKGNAPNFFSLCYSEYFGIECFIEELRGGLKDKFAEIINNSREFSDKIDKYLNRERTAETNYFLNLRQWNSFTPILRFREGDPRGGGYYIKWDNSGIAIDPGHGFIQNLFQCGLSIADIDVVIITHDHPDHTQEFPLLIDLLFQLNKRKPKGTKPKEFSFLLNTSAFSKFAPIIRYETKPHLCQILWRHQEIRLGESGSIRVIPTLTKHPELGGSDMGVGLLFNLYQEGKKCCSIGVTSDTAWTPFLVEEFKHTDILIAHLGTVHEDEILKREFYQKHLGILGLYNLFTQLLQQSPRQKIIILSEFGEELYKSRDTIANVFQSSISSIGQTQFLPADIGLKIRLGKHSEIQALCSFQEKEKICGEPAVHRKIIDGRITMLCQKHEKYFSEEIDAKKT